MTTEIELQEAWLNFIVKFTDEKFLTNKESFKAGEFRFEVKNFLGTGIIINDSYGFLTLDFRHKSCKWNVQDFISSTKIIFKSQRLENRTIRTTKWSREDYPCRIYGADNKSKIRFYRSDEINDFDKIFESYITVFQSVMFAIIRLKIKSSIDE